MAFLQVQSDEDMLDAISAMINAYNWSKGETVLSLSVLFGTEMQPLQLTPKKLERSIIVDTIEFHVEPTKPVPETSKKDQPTLAEQCELLVDFLDQECDFGYSYEISTKSLREEFCKRTNLNVTRHDKFQKLLDLVSTNYERFKGIYRHNKQTYRGLRLRTSDMPHLQ
jgi:hypothetical protein